MNELQRQVYLEVMGVDSYFPRLQLPGAKPSKQCVLPVVQKTLVESPLSVESKVIDSSSLLDSFEQDKKADSKIEYPVAVPSDAIAEHKSSGNVVPRFSLTAVNGGNNILIVDQGLDKQNNNVNPTEYIQLLQNILFAVGVQKTALSLESFVWPMVESNQIDQTEEAAKQVLEAFLSKLLNQQQIKYILVMGKDAKHYLGLNNFENGTLQFHPNLPVQVLATDSAVDILLDSLMKKQVWQDLQALLQISKRDH